MILADVLGFKRVRGVLEGCILVSWLAGEGLEVSSICIGSECQGQQASELRLVNNARMSKTRASGYPFRLFIACCPGLGTGNIGQRERAG